MSYYHINLFLISCFLLHSIWSRFRLRFTSIIWCKTARKRCVKTQTDVDKTDVWEDSRALPRDAWSTADQTANSSMPAARGDKWEQRATIRCSARVICCSIDRHQPRVWCTSPPYLATLLHPAPLSLRTGMSDEDMRLDGERNEDRENKHGKECNHCTQAQSRLPSCQVRELWRERERYQGGWARGWRSDVYVRIAGC